MELRQYISLLWKWLWLVVLAAMVAGGASYFASKSVTPLYRTSATLMVGRLIQDPNLSGGSIYASYQVANTYTQFVTREPVLRGAIEALGLNMDWHILIGQVSAYAVPRTQFIQITMVDSDPYRAKVLADAIAQQLILLSPANPNKLEQDQTAFIQSQLESLRKNIEDGDKERGRLKVELASANSARQIQDLKNQISSLEAKIDGWQANYSNLLTSLQGGQVNTLSLIEEATVPYAPFSPNVRMNVLVAAAIGAVLAAAGALLIEYLDDTVKSPEDITRLTGLSTLGGIPQITGDDYPKKLVAFTQPLSPIVEAFRILRTNLQFSALDRRLGSLMVTSPNPSEGKSIAMANLAVVMAQSGMRVALVDADLRRPTTHKIFGLTNRHGLTDAILHPGLAPSADNEMLALPSQVDLQESGANRQIQGAFSNLPVETSSPSTNLMPQTRNNSLKRQPGQEYPDLSEFLQPTQVENLFVLTTGNLPPNPAELLASARMQNLINTLKHHYDLVMFDSPPCLAVADAAILSTRVDGVIVVNDVGSTRASEARRAVEELRRVHAGLLGVVLNRLSRRGGGYNYYYYYYYRDGEKHSRSRSAKLIERVLPWISRNGKSPKPPKAE